MGAGFAATVPAGGVYCAEGFDFTGTRRYDDSTGYRSRSMLVIPMENHEHEIIGVLQLLNAKDKHSGEYFFHWFPPM